MDDKLYSESIQEDIRLEQVRYAAKVYASLAPDTQYLVFNVSRNLQWGELNQAIARYGYAETNVALPGFAGMLPDSSTLFALLVDAVSKGADVVPYLAGLGAVMGWIPPGIALKIASAGELAKLIINRELPSSGPGTAPALPGPAEHPEFK